MVGCIQSRSICPDSAGTAIQTGAIPRDGVHLLRHEPGTPGMSSEWRVAGWRQNMSEYLVEKKTFRVQVGAQLPTPSRMDRESHVMPIQARAK